MRCETGAEAANPVALAGHTDRLLAQPCAAGIGAVTFLTHQRSQDDLLKRADAALFQAKASGRHRSQFDEPRDQAAVMEETGHHSLS